MICRWQEELRDRRDEGELKCMRMKTVIDSLFDDAIGGITMTIPFHASRVI